MKPPNRSPPLPEEVARAMVGYALRYLLGFYCMLRTGELLKIEARHIHASKVSIPLDMSLGPMKGGTRLGASESVSVGEELVRARRSGGRSLQILWPSWAFSGSLNRLLIQGRWQAAKTARIYINNGLAILAEMKMPWTHGNLTFKRFYQVQASGPLPKLELAKHRSGGRGRRPQVPKKKSLKVKKGRFKSRVSYLQKKSGRGSGSVLSRVLRLRLTLAQGSPVRALKTCGMSFHLDGVVWVHAKFDCFNFDKIGLAAHQKKRSMRLYLLHSVMHLAARRNMHRALRSDLLRAPDICGWPCLFRLRARSLSVPACQAEL